MTGKESKEKERMHEKKTNKRLKAALIFCRRDAAFMVETLGNCF
jgi:hypothetical protein